MYFLLLCLITLKEIPTILTWKIEILVVVCTHHSACHNFYELIHLSDPTREGVTGSFLPLWNSVCFFLSLLKFSWWILETVIWNVKHGNSRMKYKYFDGNIKIFCLQKRSWSFSSFQNFYYYKCSKDLNCVSPNTLWKQKRSFTFKNSFIYKA